MAHMIFLYVRLQQKLYEQLCDKIMPKSAESVELQLKELQKLCVSKTLLVVLDDMVS